MKQAGFYLIIGGSAVFGLAFISRIIRFLASHPILGLALVAVVVGLFMLLYGIYVEANQDKEKESFRGIEK